MKTLNIVEQAKLIGFVLVVFATFISTVKIPAIDKRISGLEEAIAKFRDNRILVGLSKLDQEAHIIQKNMLLSEANQVIYTRGLKEQVETISPEERIKALRQEALNKTIGLAEWTAINRQEYTRKRISKILANETLTTRDKIRKVETIVDENRAIESKRLEGRHRERNKNKNNKANLEISRSRWANCFAWLQITGLIMFSGAEVIDKLIVRRNRNTHKS